MRHGGAADRPVYRSWLSDNRRWDELALREGDIVISAPSKCGVTWTQRLVSLLVFDGPDLPAPLSAVSPWLDATIRPIGEVVAALDAQRHRRFIKTHTPFDGLVLDDRVTYIGVGRDPRDAAVSELCQWDNMNLDRMRALQDAIARPGQPPPPGPDDGGPSPAQAFFDWMEGPAMPPEGAGVLPPGQERAMPPPGAAFIPPGAGAFSPPPGGPGAHPPGGGFAPPPGGQFRPPLRHMGSLANILHHFGSGWARRELPNVALFHFADYRRDLPGELQRLGGVLGIEVTRARAEELAVHASLDAMRDRAADLAPDSAQGIWRSNERFFRSGAGGEWQQFFDENQLRRYVHRLNLLAPPDLLAWAHEGRRGCDPG